MVATFMRIEDIKNKIENISLEIEVLRGSIDDMHKKLVIANTHLLKLYYDLDKLEIKNEN